VPDVPPGDRLAAATGEAAALRVAVEELVDTILSAAPAERRRWSWAYVLLIIGGPLLFVVTAWLTVSTTTQARRLERGLTHGITCLLADTDDHRYTNQEAHNQIAARFGLEIKQQDIKPLTEVQVARLKADCARFVGGAVGQAHR
jgi:hypothetical protein